MGTGVNFREIRLDSLIGRVIQKTLGMDVTSVTTIHELNLKAPVEAGGVRIQCTLACDHQLIQQRFVGAVSEQLPEVVIVNRRIGISHQSTFDPPVELKSWFRGLRLLCHLLHFLGVWIRGCSRCACLTRGRGWTGGRSLLSVEWSTKGSSINGASHKVREHPLVCNSHVLISFLATEGAFELQEWLRNARVTKPHIVGHL